MTPLYHEGSVYSSVGLCERLDDPDLSPFVTTST